MFSGTSDDLENGVRKQETTVYENLILSLLVIVAVYLLIKRKEIVEFVFPSNASGGRIIAAGWAGILAVMMILISINSE